MLLQGYRDLEYFVLDGGSSDGSEEIIRAYAPWLAGWRSSVDAGQAAAVNEGLARSSGEVFQFVNADDALTPAALQIVGRAWSHDRILAGAVLEFGEAGEHIVRSANLRLDRLLTSVWRGPRCSYHQPGVWLSRERLAALGGFADDLRYCFDFHGFARYLECWPNVAYVDEVLVRFRLHAGQKTTAERDAASREYDEARRRLERTLASPRMRRLAARGARRANWPSEVSAIRNSQRSPAGKAVALASRAIADPWVGLNRLTLGAIRRELAPASAGR